MALRNHQIDGKILEAAFNDFMACGFQRASLRRIAANANVTIGAIRTRYKSKDDLFQALINPLLVEIEAVFDTLHQAYFSISDDNFADCLLCAMKQETEMIFHLFFKYYNETVLLLCKSQGSQLENFYKTIVERKISETENFFRERDIRIEPDILYLLVTAQFNSYFEIINRGYGQNKARRYIDVIITYHTAGWISVLDLNDKSNHEKGGEI